MLVTSGHNSEYTYTNRSTLFVYATTDQLDQLSHSACALLTSCNNNNNNNNNTSICKAHNVSVNMVPLHSARAERAHL